MLASMLHLPSSAVSLVSEVRSCRSAQRLARFTRKAKRRRLVPDHASHSSENAEKESRRLPSRCDPGRPLVTPHETNRHFRISNQPRISNVEGFRRSKYHRNRPKTTVGLR